MSEVTNCILSFDILENAPERMREVDAFFTDERSFVSANDPALPRGWYGGSKMLETPLYIGAFNHLDDEKFMEHLENNVAWVWPGRVQLILQRQYDSQFSILALKRQAKAMPTLPQAHR